MTETVWLTCGDPGAMLKAARPTASDRKMRLFAAACWFRTWADQMDARTRAVVELFVGHVDGTVSPGDWFTGFTAAGGVNLGKHFRLLICTDALLAATESAKFAAEDVAWQQAWDAKAVEVHAPLDQRAAQNNRRNDFRKRALAKEEEAQALLVREVFGNPFRPVAFEPAWLTDTAVSLARDVRVVRLYARCRFWPTHSRMPAATATTC